MLIYMNCHCCSKINKETIMWNFASTVIKRLIGGSSLLWLECQPDNSDHWFVCVSTACVCVCFEYLEDFCYWRETAGFNQKSWGLIPDFYHLLLNQLNSAQSCKWFLQFDVWNTHSHWYHMANVRYVICTHSHKTQQCLLWALHCELLFCSQTDSSAAAIILHMLTCLLFIEMKESLHPFVPLESMKSMFWVFIVHSSMHRQ